MIGHVKSRLAAVAFTYGTIASAVGVEDYNLLNQTVEGRLHRGYPLAKPCYSIYEEAEQKPDLAACRDVQKGWKTDTYLVEEYGGFMNTNWATCQATTEGCPLDFILPENPLPYLPPNICHAGSLSPYYIDVRSVEDVQAGLEFARQHKVPLTIKNSGHDYQGRSSAPGSLALWTHNLQPEITLSENFIPEGCDAPVGAGVTFGAGQDFAGIYEFAEENNVTVVGGSSSTVGAAGGWIAGGGHSSISNKLGLGVDNALQIRVVLPNGTYVTANECQNQDIFYAVRGGGGSTFGVNIELTQKAHPAMNMQVAYIRIVSLDPSMIKKLLTIIVDNALEWADAGWGGYFEPGAISTQTAGVILTNPYVSLDEAKAQMKPLTDYARSLGNIALSNEVVTAGSYYSAYKNYIHPNGELVGLGTSTGGRLLPRETFETAEARAGLVNTLQEISDMVTWPVANHTDPLVAAYGAPLQIFATAPTNFDASTVAVPGSVTPAWRKTVWSVFINNPFGNQAPVDEVRESFRKSHRASQMLREVAPDSGAYINEADTFQDDHENEFWGAENYARLSKIKQELDPENILTCHHCIGWDASDSRYGCYPDIS